MKKFTVSVLTSIAFAAASMLSCFSVSAEEQGMTASITMEEFMQLDTDVVSAAQITIASDSDLSFYDQLDDNNKAAYDAIEESWTTPNAKSVTYSLTDKVTFQTESSDTSEWTEEQLSEFWGMIFATFQTGEVAFMYDYPGVFWYLREDISVSIGYKTSYSYRNKVYTITVNSVTLTPKLRPQFADEAEALEAQEFLADKISSFEIQGDDNYTKLKYIHDYISNAVTYNVNSDFVDTAYGMFVEPYNIICEGYSEAVKLLCDREGIPCISVIGNIEPENNMAHMWNYIQMEDGKWYGFDVTWDDLDEAENPVKYQYFLKGSGSFLSNHTPDDYYMTPGYVYPELSETDYVYATDEPVVTTTVTMQPVITTSTQVTTIKTTTATNTETTKATVVTTTEKTTASLTTKVSTVSTTTTTTKTVLKGDFNQNDMLDIADAVALQKMLTSQTVIEKKDFEYELNEDNKLNIFDFVILVRKFIE